MPPKIVPFAILDFWYRFTPSRSQKSRFWDTPHPDFYQIHTVFTSRIRCRPFRSRHRSTAVSGSLFAQKKLPFWTLLRAKIVPKTYLKSTLFFEWFLEHFWLHFGSILSSLCLKTRSLGLLIRLSGAPFCSLCPRRTLQGLILAHFGTFGLTSSPLLAHFWLILEGAFRHCTTD